MPSSRWLLGTKVSIAGTALNNLTNGSTSSTFTYDNTGLWPYAMIDLILGTFTPAASNSVTLAMANGDITPGFVPDTGRNAIETIVFQTGPATAGVRNANARIILPPRRCVFWLINNSGQTLAGSGNSVELQPFTEDAV